MRATDASFIGRFVDVEFFNGTVVHLGVGFVEHQLELMKVHSYTAIVTFGAEPVMSADRKALPTELRLRVTESFMPVW